MRSIVFYRVHRCGQGLLIIRFCMIQIVRIPTNWPPQKNSFYLKNFKTTNPEGRNESFRI